MNNILSYNLKVKPLSLKVASPLHVGFMFEDVVTWSLHESHQQGLGIALFESKTKKAPMFHNLLSHNYLSRCSFLLLQRAGNQNPSHYLRRHVVGRTHNWMLAL